MEQRRASRSKVRIPGSKYVPVKSFTDMKESEYCDLNGRESTADGGHEVKIKELLSLRYLLPIQLIDTLTFHKLHPH